MTIGRALLWILVTVVVGGAVSWLISRATFMRDEFKELANWAILAACVVFILGTLLRLVGVAVPWPTGV